VYRIARNSPSIWLTFRSDNTSVSLVTFRNNQDTWTHKIYRRNPTQLLYYSYPRTILTPICLSYLKGVEKIEEFRPPSQKLCRWDPWSEKHWIEDRGPKGEKQWRCNLCIGSSSRTYVCSHFEPAWTPWKGRWTEDFERKQGVDKTNKNRCKCQKSINIDVLWKIIVEWYYWTSPPFHWDWLSKVECNSRISPIYVNQTISYGKYLLGRPSSVPTKRQIHCSRDIITRAIENVPLLWPMDPTKFTKRSLAEPCIALTTATRHKPY